MRNAGFGIIGILIVVAVIALLGGGGLYLREVQQKRSLEQIGADAERRAQELKKEIMERDQQAADLDCEAEPPTGCGFGAVLSCVNGQWECTVE